MALAPDNGIPQPLAAHPQHGQVLDTGEGGQQGAEPPATTKVIVGGKEYEVDPAVAEAMTKAPLSEAEIAARVAKHLESKGDKKDKKEGADDLGIDPELIYSDPARYTKLVIDAAQKISTDSMRSDYTEDQNRRAFFSEFYLKNADLKDADLIVQHELKANQANWSKMTVGEAQDKLAEATRKHIHKLSTAGKKTSGTTVAVESGAGVAGAPAKTETGSDGGQKNDTHMRASDIIKKRRAIKYGNASS